jgi:hypothetical protein
MGENSKVFRLLGRKPKGKRPLARPRPRWVDNIKMDLEEIGWSGVDWFGVVQDREKQRARMNAVMKRLVS